MAFIIHPFLSHGSNSLSSLTQVAFFPFLLIPEPSSEPPLPNSHRLFLRQETRPTAWPGTASRAGWFVLFILSLSLFFPPKCNKIKPNKKPNAWRGLSGSYASV